MKFIRLLSLLLPAPLGSNSIFFSPPYFPVIFFMTLEDISQKHFSSLQGAHRDARSRVCNFLRTSTSNFTALIPGLPETAWSLQRAAHPSALPHGRTRGGGVDAGTLPGGCRRAPRAVALPLMGKAGDRRRGPALPLCPAGSTSHLPGPSAADGAEVRAPGRKALLPSRLPAAGEKPLTAPCPGSFPRIAGGSPALPPGRAGTAAASREKKGRCPGAAPCPA